MSVIDDLSKLTAPDRKFEILKQFHGCSSLCSVVDDEHGDNACIADMNSDRTYPCWVDSAEKLKQCNDYEGPLLEAVKQAREEQPFFGDE